MKKYTIECDEAQIRLIAQALESHSRMRCGQLGEHYQTALHDAMWEIYDLKGSDVFSYVRDEVEKRLNDIKHLVWGLVPNESWGIGFNEDADLGYETYKMILSQFEKEYKAEAIAKGEEYRGNVHTGTPLKLTNHPFIKVSMEETTQKEKIETSDFERRKEPLIKKDVSDRHYMKIGTLDFRYDEKVMYEDKIYQFRYIGQNGHAIIGEVGEYSMQDTIAVDITKLKRFL